MKKFIVLSVALLSLAACSSSEKKEMETKANDKVETAKKDMNQKVEEAKKDGEAATSGSKTSCTLDKDTRVIEVKKTESGGCELFYTKFGEAKSVASSGFGTQYCEEVKDRIQTNLNKAGFACQ